MSRPIFLRTKIALSLLLAVPLLAHAAGFEYRIPVLGGLGVNGQVGGAGNAGGSASSGVTVGAPNGDGAVFLATDLGSISLGGLDVGYPARSYSWGAASVDFGTVGFQEYRTRTLTLTNTSSTTENFYVPNSFAYPASNTGWHVFDAVWDSSCARLAPNASCVVTLTAQAGTESANPPPSITAVFGENLKGATGVGVPITLVTSGQSIPAGAANTGFFSFDKTRFMDMAEGTSVTVPVQYHPKQGSDGTEGPISGSPGVSFVPTCGEGYANGVCPFYDMTFKAPAVAANTDATQQEGWVQMQTSTGLSVTRFPYSVRPPIELSSSNLLFNAAVGETSASQSVQVSNRTSSTTVFTAPISVAGDYSVTTNCGSSLAAGASCVVNVSFAPKVVEGEAGETRNSRGLILFSTSRGQVKLIADGTATIPYSDLQLTSDGVWGNTPASAFPQTAMGQASTRVVYVTAKPTGASIPFTFTPVMYTQGSPDIRMLSIGRVRRDVNGSVYRQFCGSISDDMASQGVSSHNFYGPCSTNEQYPLLEVTLLFMPKSPGNHQSTFNLSGASQSQWTFTGSAGTVSAPYPVWGSSALPFGSVSIGAKLTAAVDLRNAGTGTANWTQLSGFTAGSGFSYDASSCAAVATDATCTVQISYSPVAAGPAVTLSNIGPAGVSGGQGLTVSGEPSTISPVQASASAYDFGDNVATGSPSSDIVRSFYFSNYSSSTVPLPVVEKSGSADFFAETGCGAELSPWTSCLVNITYRPTTLGPVQGVFSLPGVATGNASITVTANGTQAGAAQPVWGGTSVNFPSVPVGAMASQGVLLMNQGGTVANWSQLQGVTAGNGLTYDATGCVAVSPGSSCVVTFSYSPAFAVSTLNLSGIAPLGETMSGTLTVTGSGAASAVDLSTSTLEFGQLAVGSTFPNSVQVFNNSPYPASLPVMAESGSSDFLVSSNCSTTIGAFGTCDISVTFVPSSVGQVQKTISFEGSSLSLTVTGEGVEAPQAPAIVGTTNGSLASPSSGRPPSVSSPSYSDFKVYLTGQNFAADATFNGTIFISQSALHSGQTFGMPDLVASPSFTITSVKQARLLDGGGVEAVACAGGGTGVVNGVALYGCGTVVNKSGGASYPLIEVSIRFTPQAEGVETSSLAFMPPGPSSSFGSYVLPLIGNAPEPN